VENREVRNEKREREYRRMVIMNFELNVDGRAGATV
jgi:hypothetical protein